MSKKCIMFFECPIIFVYYFFQTKEAQANFCWWKARLSLSSETRLVEVISLSRSEIIQSTFHSIFLKSNILWQESWYTDISRSGIKPVSCHWHRKTSECKQYLVVDKNFCILHILSFCEQESGQNLSMNCKSFQWSWKTQTKEIFFSIHKLKVPYHTKQQYSQQRKQKLKKFLVIFTLIAFLLYLK